MNRRRLLKASAGFAVLGLSMPRALAAEGALLGRAVAGAVNAQEFGIVPNAAKDQTEALAALLERASAEDLPVFLPPGRYGLAGLHLPKRTRLLGVPGATRLVHGGNGPFVSGRDVERASFTGLVLDGGDLPLAGGAKALLELRGVNDLAIDQCAIVGSGGSGIALERAAGRIERCAISGAAEYGLFSLDGHGLDIVANSVVDCGNGGVLIHRSTPGEDGTAVARNRIARIRADRGGTGQYGNGINAFRADNVRVTDNQIDDCAFSAVRGNSAGNIQINGNLCLRSGETAIYSEFAFQGAVIADNIVDGGAHGISLANFDKGGRLCVCSGNIVRNLSTSGPYPSPLAGFGAGISVEADSAVTGNLVENAPLCGIRIGWGPFLRNVTATGNIVRKSGIGIAISVVEGSGSAVISGNILEGTPGGAIVGTRWADVATKDLAVVGAEGIAHLTVENNRAS
ncbi:TIGR03808 family TAT-translocated repetitive protein [Nitratireductor sp. ZSWI3]|uniref:TIGR03808 family TAT-translocated repetitive protein n=1 Tax=Nitratireductor sp. ZSWI3 TaxID=2966359 RepID=UPI00214F6523|nr:TIGR03808 family TAT-translocated repetitive protein [Nitratireductor sp. ZSWI3]MCR4265305.1 TIGR03808 family TAT-translocated repetitive protein [Nitratireductor sp. ZSWI3]